MEKEERIKVSERYPRHKIIPVTLPRRKAVVVRTEFDVNANFKLPTPAPVNYNCVIVTASRQPSISRSNSVASAWSRTLATPVAAHLILLSIDRLHRTSSSQGGAPVHYLKVS